MLDLQNLKSFFLDDGMNIVFNLLCFIHFQAHTNKIYHKTDCF